MIMIILVKRCLFFGGFSWASVQAVFRYETRSKDCTVLHQATARANGFCERRAQAGTVHVRQRNYNFILNRTLYSKERPVRHGAWRVSDIPKAEVNGSGQNGKTGTVPKNVSPRRSSKEEREGRASTACLAVQLHANRTTGFPVTKYTALH